MVPSSVQFPFKDVHWKNSQSVKLTSLLQFRLVVTGTQSRSFIGQQRHQGLRHYKVWRRDEFVFLGHAPQETG